MFILLGLFIMVLICDFFIRIRKTVFLHVEKKFH